jgi:shikimate kinase
MMGPQHVDPAQPRPLVLAGFMGAGKSSVGRLLATRLGRPFVDTDDEAEAIAGRSILDCFRAGDEAGFREAEAEAVRRAVALEAPVVALGGGAVLRPDTLRLLLDRTLLVHLHVPWSHLRPAIPDLMATRPLLEGSSLAGIHRLYRARLDIYRLAPVRVVVPRSTPEDAAERVLAALHGRLL